MRYSLLKHLLVLLDASSEWFLAQLAEHVCVLTRVAFQSGAATKRMGTNELHSHDCLSFVVAMLSPTRLIFTALHGMQTRSSDENSVRPSVCPLHA